jgi:hypothetical protein
MAKKNVTPKENASPRVSSIYFLLALGVVIIYMLIPERTEQIEIDEKPEHGISVIVLNGCGQTDLAQKVSQILMDNKINVIDWGNTQKSQCIHKETMIVIRHKGIEAKLEYFAEITGVEKSILALKSNSRAEFELILGLDYYRYFKI